MPDFDICITGAGCAGLSLLVRILAAPSLQHKRILLVDKGLKIVNDRTWCYWEKGEGFFEKIVHRKWSKLWFHDDDQSRLMDTAPYLYKMIRGIDFYNYCFDRIRSFNNVRFATGDVQGLHSGPEETYVLIDGKKIGARHIFNSIPFERETDQPGDWRLLQHFKGWVIRSLRPAFTPGEATIMDFRTSQDLGTCFFYVLPFSVDEALVECTFFSEQAFPEAAYTDLLTGYLSRILGIKDYVILEKELGVIPMSTARVHSGTGNLTPIGTAAGLTKPSTGYTFKFIQDDSDRIVQSLVEGKLPVRRAVGARFGLYDRILLNILVTKKLSGRQVFSSLFRKAELPDILAFLDNASSPSQDWRIIRSLPTKPFFYAMCRELFKSGVPAS